MSKEYQPLDVNLHPIGVLMPGGNMELDENESYEITEPGVYRIFTESGENGVAEFEFDVNGIISNVYSTVGTIEYFYLPANTIFYSITGTIKVNKMK